MAEYQPTSTAGRVTPYIPQGQGYISPTPVRFGDTSQIPMTPGYGPIKLESGFPGVQPLTFDFQAETRNAYEQLKPFYDRLLEFAGGDLDLAKRVLQYTYDQGMRETKEEYEQAAKEQELTFPVEQQQLQTALNRRGVLESGFGQENQRKLTESQALRKEAIDRALENRSSRLEAERGFGLEEGQRGFEKERFGLERERRGEAQEMAGTKFDIKSAIFQSELGKAGLEEQRRIQQQQNTALTGGGGGSSDERLYTGEEIRTFGYNPDTVSSIGGKFKLSQFR